MLPSYVFLDLETTGATPLKDRITEIALIRFEDGVEVSRWQTLVNPEVAIPDFIQQLTGITNAMVDNAPTFKQVAGDLLDYLEDTILCAHNVRFDRGACVQCKPSKISYTVRHRNTGEVYIAESKTEPKMIKVGCGESTSSRIAGLNSEQYAGRRDWVMKYHYGVQHMGLVESEIHAVLESYAIKDKFYFKNGARTLCREIFTCSFEVTMDAVKKIIAKHS